MRARLILLLLNMVVLVTLPLSAKEAEQVFEQYSSALVQIQSINRESGQKSSIGSGFFIGDEGVIATNYHVISSYVQNPDSFRLDYINHLDNSFPVTVLAVDVVNDLALLKADSSPALPFVLAQHEPTKGQKMYSLGNPHDLGMIVVPGTYNGIKQNSFYQRIHFTGSINPGMSGGPTVSEDGEVVGINVATAGNQIGFLVPVNKLWQLWNRYEKGNLDSDLVNDIREQLIVNQQRLLDFLLQSEWQPGLLGQAKAPSKIAKFMPCWGGSSEEKNQLLYTRVSANCTLGERVYLSEQHTTGFVQLGFSWLQSEELTDFQLARLYQTSLNHRYSNNNAGAEDVSNYQCTESTIDTQVEAQLKTVMCVRAYRKYAGIFDVQFKSMLLGKADQTLIGKYVLQGVTESSAQAFFLKFVEQMSWN